MYIVLLQFGTALLGSIQEIKFHSLALFLLPTHSTLVAYYRLACFDADLYPVCAHIHFAGWVT